MQLSKQNWLKRQTFHPGFFADLLSKTWLYKCGLTSEVSILFYLSSIYLFLWVLFIFYLSGIEISPTLFYYLRKLWLFTIFCVSRWVFLIIFSSSERYYCWDFGWDCVKSAYTLWWSGHFDDVDSVMQEDGKFFHLLMSSSISFFFNVL